MRKILLITEVDPISFLPRREVKMKDENGNISILSSHSIELFSKYTTEQLQQIEICNAALRETGHAEMTEQEIEYMLDPIGTSALAAKITSTAELQQLAGFKVEKTIVYLDAKSEKE